MSTDLFLFDLRVALAGAAGVFTFRPDRVRLVPAKININ